MLSPFFEYTIKSWGKLAWHKRYETKFNLNLLLLYPMLTSSYSKRMLYTSVVMLFLHASSFAQTDSYLHNRYALERIISSTSELYWGGIKTFSASTLPVGTVGDIYLTSTFNISAFQLYEGGKVIEGYPCKLDLRLNEFDIKTKEGIKVLPGKLVKSFIYDDSVTNQRHNFVNASEWKSANGATLSGFLEILADGKIKLVGYTELVFLKADYNVAKDVGNKDNRYIKKEKYFYIADNSINPLPKKKELLTIFGDQKESLQQYISKENLNVKNTDDLIKLFSYYNQSQTSRPN